MTAKRKRVTDILPSADFSVVYTPGSTDCAGYLTGGTEIRVLINYDGVLFAGNGYWEDDGSTSGAWIVSTTIADVT